jgi:hypothetical protein
MKKKPRKAKIQKRCVNNQIIDFDKVHDFLGNLFGNSIHAKRIESISDAVLGVITAASLAISMIGLGLAVTKGTVTKHAVKQVDRLIGNNKFLVWSYFEKWVREIVGDRAEVVFAMDWTEFDKDNHSTLAIYLVTTHGRATPVLWKTYDKSSLKNHRNSYEAKLLARLQKYLPAATKVTILADRGFGYVDLYRVLNKLKFNYVIRFKSGTKVYSKDGVVRPAHEWIGKNGRAKRLVNAKVTASNREPMPVVICVKDKKMQEPWCLVSNNSELKTREIINYYAKRWSIEPTFRDQKDIRFGMGMYNISVSKPARRDRLFFIAAIAALFLTILGAASEAVGMDRMLKANTVKTRTHSLFRQGLMLYDLIPNMAEDLLEKLMTKFNELIMEKEVTSDVFFFV